MWEEMVEQINPSGNLSYRKEIHFLMMYGPSEGLKIKKFGQAQTRRYVMGRFLLCRQEKSLGKNYPEEEPQIPGQMAIPDD